MLIIFTEAMKVHSIAAVYSLAIGLPCKCSSRSSRTILRLKPATATSPALI